MIKSLSILYIALLSVLLWASPSYAMHISEGILPVGWAGLWYAVAMPFLAYAIWKVKHYAADDLSFKPMLGLMAGAVFIISCMPIPVPTAGTCSHPCGTAISAILVGPVLSVLVAAVALLIQALFMAHGGLSTWGANIVSMGIVGSFAGYAVFKLLRSFNIGLVPAAFAAGVLADWSTYAMTSFALASALHGPEPMMGLFLKITYAFIPTQLPLGILEGFMTAGMVSLLAKKRPDILVKFKILKPSESKNAEASA